MLDSTVWRQYHKDNNFRQFLSEHCVLKIEDLMEDDKELYGALKAKLTKKELKLFAMNSAEVADADLQKEFEYDEEALKKAKFKLYKKLKQDKTRLSFRENGSE